MQDLEYQRNTLAVSTANLAADLENLGIDRDALCERRDDDSQ